MSKQPSPTRARHRSFSTKGKAKREPVTFDIDGTEFTCHAQVPGLVLLEHLDRLMSKRTAAAELLTIWGDVFDRTREVDEDGDEVEGSSEYDRFLAYVRDPSHDVEVQDLGEILTHVLGELSGRPTPPPSPSRRGRSTTSTTSSSEPDEQDSPDPTDED